MTDQLAIAIARRFIQRKDVKAMQYPDGYMPVRAHNPQTGLYDGPPIPWSMADVEAHLAGSYSYGHYLLDQESKCRLFCFDIDLVKAGPYPKQLDHTCFDSDDNFVGEMDLIADLRAAWHDRHHPARKWIKYQLGTIAGILARGVSSLELPVAAVYSGNKGVHVYGFTDEISAREAREGARMVLEEVGGFVLERGNSLYRHEDQSVLGFPLINVEIYPKQDSLDGKDLGNLLRLPLGRNLKSNDPTFFLDLKHPSLLMPHTDPYALLRSGNPWA